MSWSPSISEVRKVGHLSTHSRLPVVEKCAQRVHSLAFLCILLLPENAPSQVLARGRCWVHRNSGCGVAMHGALTASQYRGLTATIDQGRSYANIAFLLLRHLKKD